MVNTPPDEREKVNFMLEQPIPGRRAHASMAGRSRAEETADFLSAGSNLGGG